MAEHRGRGSHETLGAKSPERAARKKTSASRMLGSSRSRVDGLAGNSDAGSDMEEAEGTVGSMEEVAGALGGWRRLQRRWGGPGLESPGRGGVKALL